MEDDVHTREKESRPKHWTRGKSFYPIIKGSKCKLIDIIEDKKRSRRWQMRWWMATGNNLYFEVCLFYMEFEISFHLCSILYGSITNYMASKYKITSCIYIFLWSQTPYPIWCIKIFVYLHKNVTLDINFWM